MVDKTLACQYTQVNDVMHLIEQRDGLVVINTIKKMYFFTFAIPCAKLDIITKQLHFLSVGQLILKTPPE